MSKRVNLNAIKFDGSADNPPPKANTNVDVILADDSSNTFTWSDSDFDGNTTRFKPFTISAWINTPVSGNDPPDGGFIVTKFAPNWPPNVGPGVRHQTEWVFAHKGTRLRMVFYDGATSNTGSQLRAHSDRNSIQLNTWQHVVVTFNGAPMINGVPLEDNTYTREENGQEILERGSKSFNLRMAENSSSGIKFYVQGVSQFITEERVSALAQHPFRFVRNTTAPLGIGTTYQDYIVGNLDKIDQFNSMFEGKIADVVIFNKELSADEVRELYNDGKVKNMKEHSAYDSVISWYKMGDDEDHSGHHGIKDYVGGHHGTLEGQAHITADPSLPTDRIKIEDRIQNQIQMFTSLGRTASAKNIAGDQQTFIQGGISGDMPNTDPDENTTGFDTEGQRYLHLYWKKEAADNVSITVFGFSRSTGQWSIMSDVSLFTENAPANTYRIFEISGIDKVYFKQSGAAMASTDLFAAACSNMR